MILLGAGASKVFGLKTLQDLTTDIVAKMKEIGHEKVIIDITQAMKRYGLNPDFENIYTTIEALSNPLRGIERNGGLAAYIAFKTNYDIQEDTKGSNQYEKVLSDLRELIYKECSVSRNAIETIEKTFDQLFRVCNHSAKGLPAPTCFKPTKSEPQIGQTSRRILSLFLSFNRL